MSDLTDAIAKTKAQPPFPTPVETQNWENASYTQLDADLRFHWKARFPDEPDVKWKDLPYSVKASLRQHYRNYVGDAAAKRLKMWMAENNLSHWPKSVAAWEKIFGKSPFQDAEERVAWFSRWARD